jgi:glycosyltransferase involved in cell wall biosynthesis
MVRSLLFLDQFGYLGGAQRVLWEILKSLDSTEYDCCAAINGPGEFQDTLLNARISVLNLPLGNYHSARKTLPDVARLGVRTLACTTQLVMQGRRRPWDMLWANGPRTFMVAVLAGLATGTPVVWHLHKIFTSKSEIMSLLIFSRWVKRIIACSGAAATPFLASRRQLESKIRILYNPHPDWVWAPTDRQASRLRREFDLAGRNYLFGILGRVTPFKGQKGFLYAAARVTKQFPEARFFVIGSPAPADLTDLGYQTELRQLVGNFGLDRHVFFLPHQSNIREYIEGLDAVVMSSIGPEALPQTLIEAMFLEKPVIAPAQGGIPEMINESVTGLLYKAGDEEALTRRMLDLARCHELGVQLGLRARENVLEQFSRERFRRGIREEISSGLDEA